MGRSGQSPRDRSDSHRGGLVCPKFHAIQDLKVAIIVAARCNGVTQYERDG